MAIIMSIIIDARTKRIKKTIKYDIPVFFLMALIMGFLSGFGCREIFKKSSAICAKVNGKKIYLEDFENEINRLNLVPEEAHIEYEDQMKYLKKELLLNMIDKELLIQEAKERGIQLNDKDIEIYLKDMSRGYPAEEFPLENHLNDPSFDYQRRFISEDLVIKRLIEQVIEPKIYISEDEMRAFFLSYKKELDRDKEFRAKQIVTESEMEAREVLELLKKGYDFSDLARKRSLSPDSETGGDLGFFEIGQMPPEFDEAILSLKEGETSDIIQSDYGYHIFQLLEIRMPKEAEWKETKPKIKKILFSKKRDELFNEWLAELRERADIKIYPKAILGIN